MAPDTKLAASYLVRIHLRAPEDAGDPLAGAPSPKAPTLTVLVDAITEKVAELVPGATISATAERIDE